LWVVRETRGKGAVYIRHQSETKAREQLGRLKSSKKSSQSSSSKAYGEVLHGSCSGARAQWDRAHGWDRTHGPFFRDRTHRPSAGAVDSYFSYQFVVYRLCTIRCRDCRQRMLKRFFFCETGPNAQGFWDQTHRHLIGKIAIGPSAFDPSAVGPARARGPRETGGAPTAPGAGSDPRVMVGVRQGR